jgi:DNA-binding NarL/FixJ family response regulator
MADGQSGRLPGLFPLRRKESVISSDALPITVVLATDSSLIGDGLAALLSNVSDVEVVGRSEDLEELFTAVEHLRPQAVIMNVRSHVVTTVATVTGVRRLRSMFPETWIVVISDRANDFALELLRGSASGIAFLVDEQLSGIGAVRGALRGLQVGQSVLDPGILDSLIHRGGDEGMGDLTSREVDVLEQMAQGLSNRAIAEKLHISVKSIEKGVTAIFLKLGPFDQCVSDRRVSAALVYLRHRTDPFGPADHADDGATPVVVLKDDDFLAHL